MMTKTKHLAAMTLHKVAFHTGAVVRNDWFKWGLIAAVAWLLFSKNFSLHLSIGNEPTAVNVQPQTSPTAVQTTNLGFEVPTTNPNTAPLGPPGDSAKLPEKVQEKVQEKTPETAPKTTPDSATTAAAPTDNLANKFANIAFVLNPTYAKRHGIAPAIVAQKRAIVDAYVQRFAPVAQAEMRLHGIPASITLAQGLLESDAGGSRLAKQNNNHFGIKCFSKTCKKGHCANFTDDTHKDFFLVYGSPWESYRAHSLFLKNQRYRHLLQLKRTDYKAWAKGLREAGYATDKNYAQKIIGLIETLRLQQYDK